MDLVTGNHGVLEDPTGDDYPIKPFIEICRFPAMASRVIHWDPEKAMAQR
jgi:hypothetical protein